MKILVNEIELFYQVKGQGKPLILVHGNGEDHHIFDILVDCLKEYYTCYCLDSRGHGASTPVDIYSYQAMAEDVMEFIRQLGLKNVAYYGFSDGGIIGLLIASQSDLLDYLIISGANIEPQGIKKFIYYQMKLQYMLTKDPKIRMMLEQPHINEFQLSKIKAKTLVLAGANDVIKEAHTYYLAHHISNSQLMILPNESHGSYIIDSSKLAPIILTFLKGD